MKISIVVPSYQQAKFLRETLDSLVNQKNVRPDEREIIVVDGGSQDGSVDIIKEYAPHLTWWVSERDRGQTHALDKGFARATGELQGWLCSDDLLEPDALRTVLDAFAGDSSLQFLYGDAAWIDEESRLLKQKKEIPFNWFIWAYDHNYIPQPSAFWRRELYRQVGGLDESLHLAMDCDLWARFAQQTKPRHVRQVLSRMRLYADQKTTRLLDQSKRERREVCERYGARFDDAWRPMAAKGLRVGWKLATGCYW